VRCFAPHGTNIDEPHYPIPGSRVLQCARCLAEVDARHGRYVFVLVADRGRGGPTTKSDKRAVLCGPCGDLVREMLESFGFMEVVRT
jgi:hypothetical protein